MNLKISLFNIEGAIRQFRELVKDFLFRNRQEEIKGNLEIELLAQEKKAPVVKEQAVTDALSIWFGHLHVFNAHSDIQLLPSKIQALLSQRCLDIGGGDLRPLDSKALSAVQLN